MSREFYVPCASYAYPGAEKQGKTSSSSFGEKIRSSLPNIGHRIRRFMKRKSRRIPNVESSTIQVSKPEVSLVMTILDDENAAGLDENAQDEDTDLTISHSAEAQDTQNSLPDVNIDEVEAVASTSESFSSHQQSEISNDRDMTISRILGESATPSNRLMLPNDVEVDVSNLLDQMAHGSLVTDEGSIITGDPLDFATALSAQFGYDRIRSENSSVNSASEVAEDNTEASSGRRSDGRDEAPQYLDAAFPVAQCGSGSTDGVVVTSEVVGMDCMPLRPGPFHYLISEQAKSLVALQELQNEVGALLEFRDLVIETFPNLRHKMATSSSSSAVVSVMSTSQTSSHIPLPLSSPSSRRTSEWEPGKVRRRVAQSVREGESSGNSSLPRSRSNSHSGGSKNSATVQDSGFSTETSSKDSASTAIPRPSSPRPALDEAEDELWNLLDVIHRKGIRLREEVESLQGRLESVAPEELGISCDVLEAVKNVTGTCNDENLSNDNQDLDDEIKLRLIDESDNQRKHRLEHSPIIEDRTQLNLLRRENEQLLDRVSELEAETISSRVRAQELQSELAALSALKNGLEDRLRSVLETRNEIITPGAQRNQTSSAQTNGLSPSSPKSNGAVNIRGSKQSAFTAINSSSKAHKNRFRTRTIEKNVLANGAIVQPVDVDVDPEIAAQERRIRLGALDSVLISPTRVAHVSNVDTAKIAAILREHSPLELQRHLITTTVHNQCLQKRLDEVEKSTETLSERLDKAREENDDLRFQLEERNIELEGTRARVRVLERLQQRPPTEVEPEGETETEPRCEPCYLEPGSSTESARDNHHSSEIKPSPRRRPSRIPLPGSATKAAAPKPPINASKNDSRESLKSLTTAKPPRDSSRESTAGTTRSSLSKTATRDSSRESLNRQSISKTSGKEASRESLNRSLSRNNNANRDSINKTTTTTATTTSTTTSLSRVRESLESTNTSNNNNVSLYPPGTPPRRPPAHTRRSQSLARPSVDNNDNGKGSITDPPSSWCSSSSSFHQSESLYPDSLNQETTTTTPSTKIEFLLGSPTRHFRPNSAWPSRYFDSINSMAMGAESLLTDEFPLRGEALADCDSLECHPIYSGSD